LFGIPANKDNQTLPAKIEQKLTEKYPETFFKVVNHSVIAFRTLQQSILYKFLLLNSKPDLVFLFDGANDYIHSAHKPDLDAGDMTHGPLQYYWEQHLQSKVVNWQVLLRTLQSQLVDSAFRYSRQAVSVALRKLRAYTRKGGIEAWRDEYLEKSRLARAPFTASVNKGLELFRLSTQEIIQHSKEFGIPIVLAQQPHLMATKKTLVGREINEMHTALRNMYAFPKDKLAGIKSPPPEIPKAYYPLDLMRQAYAKQNTILAELAAANEVGYVDTALIIDGQNGKPIFFDPVHLTPYAHEVLSGEISKEIASTLNLNN